MSTTTTIHISQLPMLSICSGALHLEGEAIRYDDGSAGQGRLCHEAAAAIVMGRDPPANVPYIGTIKAIWQELRESLNIGDAEAEVNTSDTYDAGFRFVGKVDVLAHAPAETVIVDWFFGQHAPDKLNQGKGYAWLFGVDQAVRFVEVNVPQASMRQWAWTAAELKSWMDDLVYNLNRPPSYTVGQHCRWCPKFASCPAHTALMRKAANVLSVVSAVENLPRPEKGRLYCDLQVLAGLVEAAQESIKADVVANGPISLGEEYELRATHVEKLAIDPLAAWPLLCERFSDEELATAITIGKGALEALASAKAGRGQKGAAKKQIIEDLRAAGAVTVDGYDRVARARKGTDEA
jgi:hypothetical protein